MDIKQQINIIKSGLAMIQADLATHMTMQEAMKGLEEALAPKPQGPTAPNIVIPKPKK